MKILVPLKRVPDPELKTKIKDGAIDLSGASWVVNPFDEYAVETALRLLENGEAGGRTGGEIVVVTIGPADAAQQLRSALAMGADRAIRIDAEDRQLDSRIVCAVLEKVVAEEKPDLETLVAEVRQRVADGERMKSAAAEVAEAAGISKKVLYDAAIKSS